MKFPGQLFLGFIPSFFLCAALALTTGPSAALGGSVAVPKHAKATGYGAGWECERGYRNDGDGCSALEVPPNAFATGALYGPGWECSWGYRQIGDKCRLIPIPQNAYLNSFGDQWKCNRGFRPVGGGCEKIRIPLNAHIDFSGNDWECNRPYRKQRNECVMR